MFFFVFFSIFLFLGSVVFFNQLFIIYIYIHTMYICEVLPALPAAVLTFSNQGLCLMPVGHIFPAVTFGFQSLGLCCCDRWQDPSLQQPRHLHRCSILLGRVDPRKYPHGQQSISQELRKPGHLRQESEFQLRC